ncbi:MAG: MBL fold metallo-hydrolase [Crenarchaeota archaeon]|nr:MBL fold metallo-hydrolase [Thermoproteota archaeon]
MRFALLGLGGWVSDPYMDTVSVVVEVNNKRILIDCGEGILKRLRKMNLTIGDIDLLVVTHSHGDHCLGFPSIVLLSSLYSKKLRVLALRNTIEDLVELVKRTHIEKHLSNIEFVEVDSLIERSLSFQDFSIYFTYADHTIPTFSVKIVDNNGRKLAYSSDTRPSRHLIDFFKDVDVLIYEVSGLDEKCHEHGHSTVQDSLEIAKNARVRLLVPVHYYITLDIIYHRCDVPVLVPVPYHWYDVDLLLERSHRYLST